MSGQRYTIHVLILFALLLCCVPPATAQQQPASPDVPRQFHYQGCLTDAAGNRISGTKAIRFEIIDLDTSPFVVLFDETATNVVVNDGLFEHNIGSINALPPLIFQKRVGIRLTVDGETLNPPVPILPSPVAMVALYADSLKQSIPAGKDGTDGINCWDSNGNGIDDPAEDANGDGVWDARDCRGADGVDGKDGKDGLNGKIGRAHV